MKTANKKQTQEQKRQIIRSAMARRAQEFGFNHFIQMQMGVQALLDYMSGVSLKEACDAAFEKYSSHSRKNLSHQKHIEQLLASIEQAMPEQAGAVAIV